MKKITILILFFMMINIVSAESFPSLEIDFVYSHTNILEKEGLEYNINSLLGSVGFSDLFYPNYESFLGYSINGSVGYGVSFAGLDLYNLNMRFYFDLGLSFRGDDAIKGFSYFNIGPSVVYDTTGCGAGIFFELGIINRMFKYNTATSDYSFGYDGYPALKLSYNFLTIYDNLSDCYSLLNWNRFSIAFLLRVGFVKHRTKDKTFLNEFIADYESKLLDDISKEDVYSGKYKLYYSEKSQLEGQTVDLHYYRRISNESDYGWFYLSKPFLREISFLIYSLSDAKPGTDEYLFYNTKNVTMNYYTLEDKNKVLEEIRKNNEIKKQQKNRILENRKLNPSSLIYEDYPDFDMESMGKNNIDYEFIKGQIYDVYGLSSARVINVLQSGDYNIGSKYSQFILKNSSGEYIRDYLSTDTALLRYLGDVQVVDSKGMLFYKPYFELLQKNRSKLKEIIEECESW